MDGWMHIWVFNSKLKEWSSTHVLCSQAHTSFHMCVHDWIFRKDAQIIRTEQFLREIPFSGSVPEPNPQNTSNIRLPLSLAPFQAIEKNVLEYIYGNFPQLESQEWWSIGICKKKKKTCWRTSRPIPISETTTERLAQNRTDQELRQPAGRGGG